MAVSSRRSLPYTGPECPRCGKLLPPERMISGEIVCPSCNRPFEATAFTPPERQLRIVEVAQSGPEGANACANHARNSAVTSCTRCGLLICSLCDINLGDGSYCPTCFDRVRADGSLKTATTRFQDYASMARVCAIVGSFFSLMFMGILFGPATLYYASKGYRQRRSEGANTVGMVIAGIVGVLQIGLSIAMIGFLIVAGNGR